MLGRACLYAGQPPFPATHQLQAEWPGTAVMGMSYTTTEQTAATDLEHRVYEAGVAQVHQAHTTTWETQIPEI